MKPEVNKTDFRRASDIHTIFRKSVDSDRLVCKSISILTFHGAMANTSSSVQRAPLQISSSYPDSRADHIFQALRAFDYAYFAFTVVLRVSWTSDTMRRVTLSWEYIYKWFPSPHPDFSHHDRFLVFFLSKIKTKKDIILKKGKKLRKNEK